MTRRKGGKPPADQPGDGDPGDAPALSRRMMLTRIGLAGTLVYGAPALTILGQARAQDDDDDDDDGDDGGGRRGRDDDRERGEGPRRRRRQRTQAPRQRAARAAPVAPPPPPEIVLLLPAGLTLDPVLAAGYGVLAQAPNAALAATVVRLSMPPNRTSDAAVAELALLVPGSLADENHLYRPDDFLCDDGTCDAQEMIGWAGWPSAFAPRIGMIDTGINTDHAALAGQKLTVVQSDLAERAASSRQHGTAIAAMLIGRIDERTPGLLPMAELVAVEAFHRDSAGDLADAFALVAAVDRLLAERVSVINLSFSGPANAVLEQITRRAVEQGIGLVAAAGNGGPGAEPAYPAAWPHVIAVTAVDSDRQVYRQANQGHYIALAAPGVGVWTAASISGGRLRSGTSYATPFVTATLAIQRLRAGEDSLDMTVERLLSCAQDIGEAGFDPVFGHGLLAAPGQCHAGDAVFSVSGE